MGFDGIARLFDDLFQQTFDVEKWVIIAKSQHANTLLDGCRRQSKPISLHREKSYRMFPTPTLVNSSGTDGGFEWYFDFVEHLFSCQFDPLFAGSDNIDLTPGGAICILFISGDHRYSFDDGTPVGFDTSSVMLLVKHFRRVDFGGIAEYMAISGG